MSEMRIAYIPEAQHNDIMCKVWEVWTLDAVKKNIDADTIASVLQQWIKNEIYLLIDENTLI